MRLFGLALTAMAFVASAAVAAAHPHIFIRATATLQFEDGKITGIRHEWVFDEFFSSAIMADFDRNKNNAFDPEEVKEVEANAFSALKEYGYFTHVRADSKRVAIGTVRDFAPTIKDGRVVYRFLAVLPEPIDPRRVKFDAGVFDESYYVDVEVNPTVGVKLAGAGAETCKFTVHEDKDSPLYFGAVFVRRIGITCAP